VTDRRQSLDRISEASVMNKSCILQACNVVCMCVQLTINDHATVSDRRQIKNATFNYYLVH